MLPRPGTGESENAAAVFWAACSNAPITLPSRTESCHHRNWTSSDQTSAVYPSHGRCHARRKHSHQTPNGIGVHIWRRENTYMARGSYEGHRFGVRLGDTELEAEAALHELLVNIRNGAFVRPVEARKRQLKRIAPIRLTLRKSLYEFLAEKRKIRGRETTSTYTSRLGPVLNFAESVSSRKRWRLARTWIASLWSSSGSSCKRLGRRAMADREAHQSP